MSYELLVPISFGLALAVLTFGLIMLPWKKILRKPDVAGSTTARYAQVGLQKPFSAKQEHADRGALTESSHYPENRYRVRSLFTLASWICGGCAVLSGMFSIWIAASIANYGSIAELQAQTNELLFAVIIAILALCLGLAAVFFGLRAKQ